MEMHLSVIIPFYQHQRGLLRRAVLSVIEASRSCKLTIIVVDDGSPVDYLGELESIDFSSENDLIFRAVRQENKGVISARNVGLDLVDPDCDVIAFLDSDDYWLPCRPKKLEAAFAAGADLYFSDFSREGEDVSRFAWSRFDVDHGTELDSALGLLWVPNDIISMICVGRCPIGTSTVAYRRSAAARSIRFNSEFKRCAEDHYFYVELLSMLGPQGRVCISRESDVLIGQGVGLETNATWGTVASLQRSIDTCRLHFNLQGKLLVGSTDFANNRALLEGLDIGFFEALFVVCAKNRINPLPYLAEYFSFRPAVQISFAKAALNMIRQAMRRRALTQ